MSKRADLQLIALNMPASRMRRIPETTDGFLLPASAFLLRDRFGSGAPVKLDAGTVLRPTRPALLVFAGAATDGVAIIDAVISPCEAPYAVFELSRWSAPPVPMIPAWLASLGGQGALTPVLAS